MYKRQEYKKTALATERLSAMTEAGLTVEPDKLDAKKEFLTALTEEAFAEYLSDLQAVKKTAAAPTKSAAAERKTVEIPRLDGGVQDNTPSILEKVRAMKYNQLFRSRNKGGLKFNGRRNYNYQPRS